MQSFKAIKKIFNRQLRLSLENEFFLFVVIVLTAVCILSACFYYYSYHAFIDERNERLHNLAKNISQEISGIFEENEDILKFFARKISNRTPTDNLNDIVNLLLYSGNLNIKRMTHSYLVWANSDGKIVASGKEGIVTYPFDITKRKYYLTARNNPWTLQIAEIDRCFNSRSHILPIAMGVVDNKKEFIGYLLIGLRVEYISKFLDEMRGDDKLSFIVLDENSNIIFKSSDNLENLLEFVDKSKLQGFVKQENDWASEPFELHDINYYYKVAVPNYPYTIMAGKNKKMEKMEFFDHVVPRLCEFLFMGLFCCVLLYFFRKKIINPITKLSQAALAISKGTVDIKLPRQNSVEMAALSRSLLLVIKYIKRNEFYKKKLEQANLIIKSSDEARESFIKRMRLELSFSLKEIAVYSSVLFKHFIENTDRTISKKQIVTSLKKIQEAVMHIRSKTSNSLKLMHLDLISIVEHAIQINLKSAILKDINIKHNFQDDIPSIYADELRLKQIIVSLLYQSIENSPENSEIRVFTGTVIEAGKFWFRIIIQDYSFGLEQDELNKIQEKFGWHEDTEIFELTSMKIENIEKLVGMHGGKLYVQNKIYEGRTIHLYLQFQNNSKNVHYLDKTYQHEIPISNDN